MFVTFRYRESNHLELYCILIIEAGFKEALAIRRIFSLVDMITKTKISNHPYVFKIGLFR